MNSPEFIEQARPSHEFQKGFREPIIVAPELLLVDNASKEAQEKMGTWHENYCEGNITLIWKCCDARVVNPSPLDSIVVATVAATDRPERYRNLIDNGPFRNVAIIGHFGCGALAEKQRMDAEESHPRKGILKRVKDNIQTHDVVKQTSHAARHFSEHTFKNVFAMVQDHGRLKNYVIGVYYQDGSDITSTIPYVISKLQHGEIDIKTAYARGIPTISDSKIRSMEFDGFVDNMRQRREELLRAHPDLPWTQRVQDPAAVVLTTDPQPLENRYPGLFGAPNSAFQVLVPRYNSQSDAKLPLSGLRLATDHAEYPLTHAVQNYGTDGPFANTTTIFIETKDMRTSQLLAGHLLGKPYVIDFLNLSNDHQIIVGETKQGKLQRVERFDD